MSLVELFVELTANCAQASQQQPSLFETTISVVAHIACGISLLCIAAYVLIAVVAILEALLPIALLAVVVPLSCAVSPLRGLAKLVGLIVTTPRRVQPSRLTPPLREAVKACAPARHGTPSTRSHSGTALLYRADDGETDYLFSIEQRGGEYRIYILDDLDYGGRPSDGHSAHYFQDGSRRFVCWGRRQDGTYDPLLTIEDAFAVAALWAEYTQDYVHGSRMRATT